MRHVAVSSSALFQWRRDMGKPQPLTMQASVASHVCPSLWHVHMRVAPAEHFHTSAAFLLLELAFDLLSISRMTKEIRYGKRARVPFCA